MKNFKKLDTRKIITTALAMSIAITTNVTASCDSCRHAANFWAFCCHDVKCKYHHSVSEGCCCTNSNDSCSASGCESK